MPRRLIAMAVVSLSVAASTSAQQSQVPESGYTLTTNAHLVVVDVIVTDRNNQPVLNLKPSDFSVTENRAPQQIERFEEHAVMDPKTATEEPRLPPGVFTNFSRGASNGALNVLLIDMLNMSLKGTGSQEYVRSEIRRYLQHAVPGASTAIFVLSNKEPHLQLKQGFTSDLSLLNAAIDATKSETSTLFSAESELYQDETALNNANHPGADERRSVEDSGANQGGVVAHIRVQSTLGALSDLSQYLSGLRGRKNVIWFAGSFPGLPDGALYRLFSRNQIAIYPVVARGFESNMPPLDPAIAKDPSAEKSDLHMSPVNTVSGGGRDPGAESKYETAFFENAVREQENVRHIAEQTGGKALFDNNGFSEAIERDIRNGSNYYTLSYIPTDAKYDGNFRAIDIQVKGKDYRLTFRRGYYAEKPNQNHHSPEFADASDAMRGAMMHGAPDATQIILKARVVPAAPASAPSEKKLPTGTTAGPDPSLSRGPYRDYAIDMTVMGRTLKFAKTSEGRYHGEINCYAVAFDVNGRAITSTNEKIRVDLPDDVYAQTQRSGLPAHLQIAVPEKGEYYLRVGVHEAVTDRVGALEFPLNSVKALAPTVASSAPGTAAQPN